MERAVFTPPGLEPSCGIFIRDKLKERDCEYPYKIWKELVEERKERGNKWPSYKSFYKNYFTKLKDIELIKEVPPEEVEDYQEGFGPTPRQYYRIADGKEDSDCWHHPQTCYDPLSGLGEKDYKELKEDAEEKGIDYEELFIERNQEDIREIANELGVSKEEVEERIRKSKKIKKIQLDRRSPVYR